MKKTIIVTPQSFLGMHAESTLEIIRMLTQYRVYFFKDQKAMCEISSQEALNNYYKIISCLEKCNVEYRVLPVFGFDELFYMLKSPSFCKFFDDGGKVLHLTPTDNAYAIGLSANVIGFTGTLMRYSRYANDVVFFSEFNYRNMQEAHKWKLAGLDLEEVVRDAKDKSYHFELNGKNYRGTVPDIKSSASGITGYTFTDEFNNRIKIWMPNIPIQEYFIVKIKKMIKAPHPDNVSFPKALVYNSSDVPIGFVMDNFKGESVSHNEYSIKLEHPVKSVSSIMRNLVASEMFSLIHSDFFHNMLFYEDEAYLIDVEGCQYGRFPITSRETETNNGIPHKYESSCRYWSTCPLSYWAAYMSVSAFFIPCYDGIDKDYDGTKDFLVFTEDSQYFGLNDSFLQKIKSVSPILEKALLLQYYNIIPLHPMRYYYILMSIMEGKNVNQLFDDIMKYVDEIGIDISKTIKIVQNNAKLSDTVVYPAHSAKKAGAEKQNQEYDRTYDPDNYVEDGDATVPEKPEEKNTPEVERKRVISDKPKRKQKERLSDSYQPIPLGPEKGPIHIIEEEQVNERKFKPEKTKAPRRNLKEVIHDLWIHIIYSLFYEQITEEDYNSVHGFNIVSSDDTQKDKEQRAYTVIKKKKLWKRPLIAAIGTILLSAGMLLIAKHL